MVGRIEAESAGFGKGRSFSSLVAGKPGCARATPFGRADRFRVLFVGLRVLLVDDSLGGNSMRFRTLLELEGARNVAGGRRAQSRALAAATSDEFDLILSDIGNARDGRL